MHVGTTNRNKMNLLPAEAGPLFVSVQDTNASFLCSELRSIGWQVRRLATVPDDVAAIAAELTDMSDKYDVGGTLRHSHCFLAYVAFTSSIYMDKPYMQPHACMQPQPPIITPAMICI